MPLSAYYFGEIERGQASPSLNAIQDIAKALGVRIRDLFPEEETLEEITTEVIQVVHGLSSADDLSLLRKIVNRMSG